MCLPEEVVQRVSQERMRERQVGERPREEMLVAWPIEGHRWRRGSVGR